MQLYATAAACNQWKLHLGVRFRELQLDDVVATRPQPTGSMQDDELHRTSWLRLDGADVVGVAPVHKSNLGKRDKYSQI